jgi:AraC family transcriptional regulator of adaptative response/methylated-DNA-[protein]-cysteine methyltransferase
MTERATALRPLLSNQNLWAALAIGICRASGAISRFESKGRSAGGRQAPHADTTERERNVPMTTRGAQADDPRETLCYAIGDSTLGSLLVASSAKGVASILIGDDPAALIEELRSDFPGAVVRATDDNRLVARVAAAIENPSIPIDLPLDTRGTAFQQKVWAMLRTIPVGVTWTYTALAHHIGEPKAVRAVASACAANKHAVVIPCHRVVRSDGASCGYRWGVQRKRTLIALETASVRTVA